MARATNNFCQMIIIAIFMNKLVNDYECIVKLEAGEVEVEIIWYLIVFLLLNLACLFLQLISVCYNSGWEERHRRSVKAILAKRFEDDHAPCIGSITPHLLPTYCQIYEEMFPYRDTLELRF